MRNNQELNHRPIQMAPLMDEYTTGFQIRSTLVLDNYSPLLAPLTTEESTLKAVYQPPKPTEETKLQTVKPPLAKRHHYWALHLKKTINFNTRTPQMTFLTS